jgi:hypothetical protein
VRLVRVMRDDSEGFAFTGCILGKGFCGKRIELAVVDVCCKIGIPAFCIKIIEPGAKLSEFRFGKFGNLRFNALE